jgi:hypothetical protein
VFCYNQDVGRTVRPASPMEGDDMAGDLADLRARLADVTADLARAPLHKIGTEWHRARVEEARWLVRSINRMEGRDPLSN